MLKIRVNQKVSEDAIQDIASGTATSVASEKGLEKVANYGASKVAGQAAKSTLQNVSKLAGPLASGAMAAYEGITGTTDGSWQQEMKKWLTAGGGFIGGLVGSATGAAAGTALAPGAGTAAGGIAGGTAGDLAGRAIADKASNAIIAASELGKISDQEWAKKHPTLANMALKAKQQWDTTKSQTGTNYTAAKGMATGMWESKNNLNNHFFQHAVNKVIDSLESDNYNLDLSKFDQNEVKMGMEKEQEHTDDPRELSKIVADHLEEDPQYYSKMEKTGFDDYSGIFQKEIKSEIDEGRSKWRWTNKLVRELKTHIIKMLQNNLNFLIQNRRILYSKHLFRLNKKFKDYPLMQSFGNVWIAAKDGSSFGVGGAFYAYRDFTADVEGQDIKFSRGDFLFNIIIPRDLTDINEVKDKFQKISVNLTEVIGHELKHFIDDFKDPSNPLQPTEKQNLFYKMPWQLVEDYNYYMSEDEMRAYVEGAMKTARFKRIPFADALYDTVYVGRLTPKFGRSSKFEQISSLIMYKYLRHAIKTFNSVMDEPESNKYFAKLERIIINNKLQNYVKDTDEEQRAIRDKEKERRRQEWERSQRLKRRPIAESKTTLSKYWAKRAKSRAKRAGRKYPNNTDKNWAKEQEEKSKDIGSTLKKAFEQDIKESENFVKSVEEVVSFFKKKKLKEADPFLDAPTGRMKGFKQKHRGSVKVAPGETFGPLEEDE